MRIRTLSAILGSLVLVVCSAAPAVAQAGGGAAKPAASSTKMNPDAPNDLSLSYMLLHFTEETYKVGFGVRVSHALKMGDQTCIRAVGGFDYYHLSGDNAFSFEGGVKVGLHEMDSFHPFGEVTFGAIHWGRTDPILRFGGGADVKVEKNSKWDLHLQFDVPVVFSNGTHAGSEFQAGVRFLF